MGSKDTQFVSHIRFVQPFANAAGLECGGRFFRTNGKCREYAREAEKALSMPRNKRYCLITQKQPYGENEDALWSRSGENLLILLAQHPLTTSR